VHPVACDAAAALKLVRTAKGDLDAWIFAERLYSKRGKLKREEIIQHLESLGLSNRFENDRTEIERVREDALFGQSVGVTGTPSVFVDGRILRNAQPNAFEAILNYHISSTAKGIRESRN
jgi:protein-disulfide isomerase